MSRQRRPGRLRGAAQLPALVDPPSVATSPRRTSTPTTTRPSDRAAWCRLLVLRAGDVRDENPRRGSLSPVKIDSRSARGNRWHFLSASGTSTGFSSVSTCSARSSACSVRRSAASSGVRGARATLVAPPVRARAASPGLRPRAARRLRALHLGLHLFRGPRSLRDTASRRHFLASMHRFVRISTIVDTPSLARSEPRRAATRRSSRSPCLGPSGTARSGSEPRAWELRSSRRRRRRRGSFLGLPWGPVSRADGSASDAARLSAALRDERLSRIVGSL